MNEEVKCVGQFWEKKFGSNVDSMYYENRLLEIDLTFRECDEILEEASVNAGEKLKRGITDYKST